MLSRLEFHMAVTLALSALNPDGRTDLNTVCFDFWPDSLRIVGTDGRRLAVTSARVPGLPNVGKFLMPVSAAHEALEVFDATAAPRVTLSPFGQESMIITSGEDALMVSGTRAIMYPEYQILVQPINGGEPTRSAVLDMSGMEWALCCAQRVGTGALAVSLSGYGACTFRPELRDDLAGLHSVIIGVKPVAVIP